MRGLRTQENEKFKIFFEKVQDEASKSKKTFFLDTGNCKDIEFANMQVDDICGWLIPNERVKEFEERFLRHDDLGDFVEFFTWCIATLDNNKLTLKFEHF